MRSRITVAWSFALLAAMVAVEADAAGAPRRVNAPYFQNAVPYPEAAVFWFGRVDGLQNYADVRVAYTSQELWVNLSVFDQWLWEDDSQSRTPGSLEQWDAVTLVLDTSAAAVVAPTTKSYRFVGELNWWRPRTDYQAAYAGTGSGWTHLAGFAFTTETGWRGDAPNTSGPGGADRGWVITFHIPFASLGLTSPPPTGTTWRFGILLHDRDSSAQPAVSDRFWPEGFLRDQPVTWGLLGFGLRSNDMPPAPSPTQTHLIRHNLNGAVVTDAMVGGGSVCGGGIDYFAQWGGLNYAGDTTLVIQNQGDVADWPCFSKVYLDFPLNALPSNKVVVGATLTMYQFGGSDPTQAQPSLVQVFTVDSAWSETSLTWNNAPLAVENVAQSWVGVITSPLPWPGAARTWNVSWAVSEAYNAGQAAIRLALYSADGAYHSGKYLTSSETGDWNAAGRPSLTVILADPNTVPPRAPTAVSIKQ